MIRTVKIRILNEVYIILVGLHGDHLEYLYNKYAILAANYFFQPKFKLGQWDGRIRYFGKDGKTYLYLLDEILPDLKNLGYKIVLDDVRETIAYQPEFIKEDIFAHINHLETGKPIVLRDYQVEGVNKLIETGYGVCLAGTGSGKTLCCCGLIKAYDDMDIKSITIVPDQTLIRQTKREYINCKLDTGEYSGKEKTLDHKHIVSTWQALKNNPKIILNFDMVIVDECVDGNTNITMDDYSTKLIKDIQIGDKILSFNTQLSIYEIDTVVELYKNLNKFSTEKMYELEFDNGVIVQITGNHMILTDDGYVRADELTEQHNIINIDGVS